MKSDIARPDPLILWEVNKSRLTDHFNKIPGEREKEVTYNLTVIFNNKGELTE